MTDSLRRYCQLADAAIQRATMAAHSDDGETLFERLDVLHELARNHDLIAECFDLEVDLVEVVSAIAYARLAARKPRRYSQDQKELQDALGRIRTAKHRAVKKNNRAHLRSLSVIRKLLVSPAPATTSLLWAHAGLLQYFDQKKGYQAASRSMRARLDALLADLLRAAGLSRTQDYQSLRRHRRLLIRYRPRLFASRPPSGGLAAPPL